MALDKILREAQQQMEKAVEHLRNELRGIRTGRASPGLVESLRIEVSSYGSTLTLKELASIAVAEGNVIVVRPFDPATLKDIEKGIEKSDLGINPQNDGKMIRLPVPPLSGERRTRLVERVKQLAEQQRVAVRNIRRDAKKALDAAQKAKTLTEDDVKRGDDQVQKHTDDYTRRIDRLVEEKTREIMEL
jgi:ribosome recycling factor